VITRANAAGSNTVRSSTKIKAAGGYMTMGGYQTVGFTVVTLREIQPGASPIWGELVLVTSDAPRDLTTLTWH
jgi:hypothetical protein